MPPPSFQRDKHFSARLPGSGMATGLFGALKDRVSDSPVLRLKNWTARVKPVTLALSPIRSSPVMRSYFLSANPSGLPVRVMFLCAVQQCRVDQTAVRAAIARLRSVCHQNPEMYRVIWLQAAGLPSGSDTGVNIGANDARAQNGGYLRPDGAHWRPMSNVQNIWRICRKCLSSRFKFQCRNLPFVHLTH